MIFVSTLAKMGLNYMSLLTPSKAPFYGIVPGNSSTLIGSVTLPVTFGTEKNFRTKYVKFEVADFESSYHTILGRPVLAKFMVVSHYAYLLLKMLGNTGVLSLRGDLHKEAIDHAATIRVPSSVSKILAAAKELSLKESMPSKKPNQSSVKPTGDVGTKTIQLQERDDSKTAIIGAGLGDK